MPPPSSHKALDPTGRDTEVDPEEQELERAGRTLTAPLRSPYDGPACPVSGLVPFDSPVPIVWCPEIAPNLGGWAPPRPIDFYHNVRDIRSFRSRNLYADDEKDLRLEYHFWHYFHFCYYDSILYRKSLKKGKPLVIQMMYIIEYSLSTTFKDQEIQQMVEDLRNMGLSGLMEFPRHWNNEVIMQFYASYFHETDSDSDTDVIHCTTEGRHYKVDFVTFAHLLGFNGHDHRAAEITDYEDVAMLEYQFMYLEGFPADGQTVYLKPYYYVLNYILQQILYPKEGDDSQKVLARFGDDFQKFSVSRYIRNLPYAPYIIQQVSGIRFPSDGSNHKVLRLANQVLVQVTWALKARGAAPPCHGGPPSALSRRAAPSPATVSHSTSSQPLTSSGKGKKPSKFKFLMTYMLGQCCASAQQQHDI